MAAMVAGSFSSGKGKRSVSPRIMIESSESSKKIKTNAAMHMVRTLIEDID